MWTQRQLLDGIKNIGLSSGSAVIVHASMEAIGPIEGGPDTLVAAFREALGAAGTLLVPCFGRNSQDLPVGHSPDISDADKSVSLNDESESDPTDSAILGSGTGSFADAVLRQPDVQVSDHPLFSFAALGAEAEAMTSHAPFHYPLGSEGPLARVHQRNGWILLVGVDHTANASLNLAEIWANVPYVHRSVRTAAAGGVKLTMQGNPECTAGFVKIEPLLRQSRILSRGPIGSAESRLMRQQQTVSMAVAMLEGSASALLCDDSTCRACNAARRMTADQVAEPI